MIKYLDLTEEQLDSIESELSNTERLLSDPHKYKEEIDFTINGVLPFLSENEQHEEGLWFAGYAPKETIPIYYTTKNSSFNNLIKDIFDVPTLELFYISEVIYRTGGELVQHCDTHSDITINVMLGGTFTGGQLFINNEPVDFTRRGQAVHFPGSITPHRVLPIESGERRILSMWGKIPGIELNSPLL